MCAVAIAHAGENQFPPKVKFGRLNGRVYAQFDVPKKRLH
jgi:hypothetical protein